jgi:hypothetical protein
MDQKWQETDLITRSASKNGRTVRISKKWLSSFRNVLITELQNYIKKNLQISIRLNQFKKNQLAFIDPVYVWKRNTTTVKAFI